MRGHISPYDGQAVANPLGANLEGASESLCAVFAVFVFQRLRGQRLARFHDVAEVVDQLSFVPIDEGLGGVRSGLVPCRTANDDTRRVDCVVHPEIDNLAGLIPQSGEGGERVQQVSE